MNKEWWRNAIVYQIYPRSFKDSNGDGIGDIPGIIEKLDYLKSLGVDCLWLSPVYASPNCDNGYDISDYKAIHPDFGTMEDFDLLVKEAKDRGIKIVMDLVLNHTSDEHEWFRKALDGDKKYENYYFFREKKNNWGSFFGGSAWDKVPAEDKYYLHLFSKKQPDLNWSNPDVYNEFVDIMRFWLDKGVAGFRCDVVNVIYKNSLEKGKRKIALTGIEHYLSTEGNHDILRRLRKDVLDKYDCFTVGETVFVDPQTANLLMGENRKELNMVFGFEHMECDCRKIKWFRRAYNPERLIRALDKWQVGCEWPANYLENHDQPRSVSRFGDEENCRKESAKMLCVLNLSLRGTPYIYEGEEIGMTNGDFKKLAEIKDVESHNVYDILKKLPLRKSTKDRILYKCTRDNARTPMQWDNSATAGFTSGMPWLKINGNHEWINVEDDEKSENGVIAFYREMIAYRKSSEALQFGDYKRIPAAKGVYAFYRTAGDSRVMVVMNMNGYNEEMPKIDGKTIDGKVVITNYGRDFVEELGELKPYEAMVLEV
ncbi:MAG: glucohydrolase [Lachnospiraceae bacterium]|nr:glucohydrolase [Lachnospiraceae bacterium]